MEVVEQEQPLCPCYTKYQEFHKVIEHKDTGLVIYCHNKCIEEDLLKGDLDDSGSNTSHDVFILHNTKDVKITPPDLMPALEKNDISCPRCRKIFEHAKQLLQKVTSIDKKNVMGVCDHCLKKAQSIKKPCNECEEIVKKFILTRGEQKEDTKRYIKIWLSKMRLKGATKPEKPKKEKIRAHSELEIDRLCQHSPKSRREPKVKQLFYPESHKSDTNLYTKMYEANLKEGPTLDKSVVFAQPIELAAETTVAVSPTLHESDTTFVEPYEDVKDPSITPLKDQQDRRGIQEERLEHYDESSINVKDAMKKKHDLSLRHTMKPEKESAIPYSVSERPEMYDIPKIAPWEQQETQEKQEYYDESEMDVKVVTKKKHYPISKKREISKTWQKNQRESRRQKVLILEDLDESVMNVKSPPKRKFDLKFKHMMGHETETRDPFSHEMEIPDERVSAKIKSKKPIEPVDIAKDIVKRQFSYFFPKKKEVKQLKLTASSSQLIQSTKEKLSQQAEEDKKKHEEERIKKREEERIKKLEKEEKKKEAREERKRQAEEKKRQAEEKKRQDEEEKKAAEERKKYEDEQKLIAENERKRREEEKRRDKSKEDKPRKKKIEKRDPEFEVKGKKTKESEDAKKDFRHKPEPKDLVIKKIKSDNVTEKARKDLKTKSEPIEKLDQVTEKAKKDSEPEPKDKFDKEAKEKKDSLTEVKEIDKAVLAQQEKERQEHKKRVEELAKTKLDASREKEAPPKKTEELFKGEPPKKAELAKKLQKASASIAEPLPKKQQSSKKEGPAKSKEKISSKKEESAKVTEKSNEDGSKVSSAPEKDSKYDAAAAAELRKLKEELQKQREEDLKNRKQDEAAAQKIRDLAAQQTKEILAESLKQKQIEKELKKKRQEEAAAQKARDLAAKTAREVITYDNKLNMKTEIKEIIIGENIYESKPPLEKTKEHEVIPVLFQSRFQEESVPLPSKQVVENIPQTTEPVKPKLPHLPTKDAKGVESAESNKGIIRYALSDRTFIDKGWTVLPTEKVVRKMNVYRMRPAHPEFDWFEHNKNKRLMSYDTGEKLAEFDDNGRGRWYYRSGRLALDYYDAEETNAQQRFVVYSSGEPDERGRTHPITILATFDYLGNGIVFDHAGKIRLKYNQTEGVVLDRGIGPVSHWKWHTLNDPPVLQQVMIDTQMAHKDPQIVKLGPAADSKARPDNEEMLAIEFDNFIKEKSKKLSQKFKPFQIKMKALKINEHFSLKVLDQATIYLIFRDGSTNVKLNIGMILDHQEIVDTDTAEVGEVSNSLERFPARTDSLAGLQRSVAYAQRYERQRTERDRRLRPPEPCGSADQLTAAVSPPLRLPLRTVPTGSTSSACYCNSRKPTNNLYYNTRLL